MVADDYDSKIDLKIFHNEIQNDHLPIRKEEEHYEDIPKIRDIVSEIVQIKQDTQKLLASEHGTENENSESVRENVNRRGVVKGMQL